MTSNRWGSSYPAARVGGFLSGAAGLGHSGTGEHVMAVRQRYPTENKSQANRTTRAWRRLNDFDRLILGLRYKDLPGLQDKFPAAQIARRMGVSESYCRRLIRRAKQRLLLEMLKSFR
jgi:DNA-directed RNA polymerase specialized sigma subunit